MSRPVEMPAAPLPGARRLSELSAATRAAALEGCRRITDAHRRPRPHGGDPGDRRTGPRGYARRGGRSRTGGVRVLPRRFRHGGGEWRLLCEIRGRAPGQGGGA